MKTIKLIARGGYIHTLEHIGNDLWQFVQDLKSGNTYRLIGEYPDNIKALDPPGGPYMSVGDEIEGYTIKSIRKGGVFELVKK
jgi:hypothetical protein